MTLEAEFADDVIDEIFEKTFVLVTVIPAAPAVSTSVCVLPNWSNPTTVYLSPVSVPAGVMVIAEGSKTTDLD